MAQERVVTWVCDQCGIEQAEGDPKRTVETRTIVVDGQAAEAELCESDYAPIREAFEQFLEVGRRVPNSGNRKATRAS